MCNNNILEMNITIPLGSFTFKFAANYKIVWNDIASHLKLKPSLGRSDLISSEHFHGNITKLFTRKMEFFLNERIVNGAM